MENKCCLRTERAHYMRPGMCFGILARIRAGLLDAAAKGEGRA